MGSKKNIDLCGKTYIVQGFGNVGSNTSILLSQLGMICIGVADHTRCIKSEEGFNVYKLQTHCKEHKNIEKYPYGETINKEDFFSIECSIIIPAAKELVIVGEEDGNKLNCELVVEAANGPIDTEAEKIILDKGIEIIPDILANSGGVVVSYYEWLQNKRCEYWSKKEVLEKLETRMEDTFNLVYEKAKTKGMSMRNACYILSIQKIAEKIKRRKLF